MTKILKSQLRSHATVPRLCHNLLLQAASCLFFVCESSLRMVKFIDWRPPLHEHKNRSGVSRARWLKEGTARESETVERGEGVGAGVPISNLFPSLLLFCISLGVTGSHIVNCTICPHSQVASSLSEIMQVNRHYWNRCSLTIAGLLIQHFAHSSCYHGRWIHSVWFNLPIEKNPIWKPKSGCLNLGASSYRGNLSHSISHKT